MLKRQMLLIPLIFIIVVGITLYSRSYFICQNTSPSTLLRAGTLCLNMDTGVIRCTEKGVNKREAALLPGQHQEIDIAITNSGTVDACWRLGIKSAPGDGELMKDLVCRWLLIDKNGKLYGIREGRLSQFLAADEGNKGWLYGEDVAAVLAENGLRLPGLNDKGYLSPQGSCHLKLVMELSPAAGCSAADKGFSSKIVLEGRQVNQKEWVP